MHFVMLIYPDVDEALVGRLRREHDPTVDLLRPHMPVVFPVAEQIGLERLVRHASAVTAGCRPFELRLGRLRKSRDHWLFLTPVEGSERVGDLFRLLNTGILADDSASGHGFVPHVGLGLFNKVGSTYDRTDPREEDFDAARYARALREAQPLRDGLPQQIDTVHLVGIPDDVVEWSDGARTTFPGDARAKELRAFRLGGWPASPSTLSGP